MIFAVVAVYAQEATQPTVSKPKLIVNIVISQMRYDYLERFADNFTNDGFRLLMDRGVDFRSARYNYMMTNTVAGLATISTGANPSAHGAISENWIDYTTNRKINIIEDPDYKGLDCESGKGAYSARNLSAATLGDRMKEADSVSKIISIASNPVSAIVSGGPSADTYWLDEGWGRWISSTYYFDKLPLWVSEYNDTNYPDLLIGKEWIISLPVESYKNKDMTVLRTEGDSKPFLQEYFNKVVKLFKREEKSHDYAALNYTPSGNSIVANFVREAIVREELGKDEHTDLLNVCFDTPRYISERFGPRSMELEDMYYKLDVELGSLFSFITSQFKDEDVIIMLTSDHGSSDTFKEDSRIPMGQFNPHQFKIIMNGFLSAQYEPGEWVLEYNDRQLYFNREHIYNYGLVLAEVQTRAAAFALQFRGVANAMTSTAMQDSYFGRGFGEKIQNSFYPKRSGDITINLMPGWIEEDDDKVSLSGSLYEYDVHVPLIFYGGAFASQKVDRDIDMTSVAPTLARVLQLTPPNASSGDILTEITNAYEN